MIQMTVRVVYDNMPQFGGVAETNLRKGSDEFVDNVLEDMKLTVPVQTGELRDGLEKVGHGNLPDGVYGAIVSKADHWIFIEFGTRHMVAQPFVTPAAQKNFPAFREGMAKQVQNAVLSLAGPAVVG